MEQEDEFLRRIVIRLRGALSFASSPEVQTMVREVIASLEDRLVMLDEAKVDAAKG